MRPPEHRSAGESLLHFPPDHVPTHSLPWPCSRLLLPSSHLTPPFSPPCPWRLLPPPLWKSNTSFPGSSAYSSCHPVSDTASCGLGLQSRSPSSPPSLSSPCSGWATTSPCHRPGPHSLTFTRIWPKATSSLPGDGAPRTARTGPAPTNKVSRGNLHQVALARREGRRREHEAFLGWWALLSFGGWRPPSQGRTPGSTMGSGSWPAGPLGSANQLPSRARWVKLWLSSPTALHPLPSTHPAYKGPFLARLIIPANADTGGHRRSLHISVVLSSGKGSSTAGGSGRKLWGAGFSST